jgi:REase_DpnII-MboI
MPVNPFQWTKESALAELRALVAQIDSLEGVRRRSAPHVEWVMRVTAFLAEVFGCNSSIYQAFISFPWEHRGQMFFHMIGAEQEIEYKHQLAYVEQLETARGLLKGAQRELKRKGVAGVYEGKDTEPEASAIVKVLSLTEHKLRKTIREAPSLEKEVQNAVEALFLAADIEYAREVDHIEYSSKTYVPDFTLKRIDLAVEIKLCDHGKREKAMISEINDDILAYKQTFGNLLFVIYDVGQIRDVDRFKRHFEQQDRVIVQVVKH